MTSYGVDDVDTKIGLVRALGVNENLTVIASAPSSGLRVGDNVAHVDGYKSGNKLKMIKKLMAARDRGEPFELGLASGREVMVSPIKVCRGHVLVASPFEPALQRYHWTESVHPLEVFHRPLTEDEAQWIVLWTQGLSERGGVRMKTYAFMVGGVKWIGVLAIGFGASSAAAAAGGGLCPRRRGFVRRSGRCRASGGPGCVPDGTVGRKPGVVIGHQPHCSQRLRAGRHVGF
jgi:hypothetical protein